MFGNQQSREVGSMKGGSDQFYVIYVVVINIFFSWQYIMASLVSEKKVMRVHHIFCNMGMTYMVIG